MLIHHRAKPAIGFVLIYIKDGGNQQTPVFTENTI